MVQYLNNFILQKGYLRGGDAIRLLTAPGAPFGATVTTTNGIDTLTHTLPGTAAAKVYPVTDADPVTAIFCDSHNYLYNQTLTTGGALSGVNGFIVVRKGGDAAVFKAGQALASSWPNKRNVSDADRCNGR